MTPPGIQQDFGVCTVCISCSSEAVYLFTNHSNQKDVRSFHVHTLFIDGSCAAVHPCPGSFVSRDARQPFPKVLLLNMMLAILLAPWTVPDFGERTARRITDRGSPPGKHFGKRPLPSSGVDPGPLTAVHGLNL